jgi:hypothetical protein
MGQEGKVMQRDTVAKQEIEGFQPSNLIEYIYCPQSVSYAGYYSYAART